MTIRAIKEELKGCKMSELMNLARQNHWNNLKLDLGSLQVFRRFKDFHVVLC